MNENFPVLVELPLAAPARRWGGMIPSKRPLSDLPIQEPGTVLVFGDNGGHWTRARGRISGTEPYVVDAISVSVVRTRMQAVDTRIEIPSFSAADDFTVKVQFSCRVTDAEEIARQGPIDMPRLLADFLRRDRGLLVKGQQSVVEDIRELRITVDARVRAYCDEASPEIPGMEVKLASVEVLTPTDYRTHATKVRDTVWSREIAEMLSVHQDKDVRRLAEMFRHPEMIAAVGKLEDKIDMQTLLNEALADRRVKDANILELLKLLEKNGQLDRLPIDARSMVDTLMDRLAGTGVRVSDGSKSQAFTLDAATLTSIGGTSTDTADTGKPDNGKPDNGKPDNGKPDNGKPDNGKTDADKPHKEERFAVDSHADK